MPHGYEIDPSFAEWVHRQRTTYAAMLKETMPNQMVQDRMKKLVEMGFNFTVHSDKWMDHWHLLKEYKAKHGHCKVPTHYEDNPKLGRWTHTQRHQRRLQVRGKKSCMTPGRIDLLDQLEFSWEVNPAMEQPRATWHQRYHELQEFFQENEHFLVPAEVYPKLHLWTHEQRTRLKNLDASGKDASRRMGPDRVQALEALGFNKEIQLATFYVLNLTDSSHFNSSSNGDTNNADFATSRNDVDVLEDLSTGNDGDSATLMQEKLKSNKYGETAIQRVHDVVEEIIHV